MKPPRQGACWGPGSSRRLLLRGVLAAVVALSLAHRPASAAPAHSQQHPTQQQRPPAASSAATSGSALQPTTAAGQQALPAGSAAAVARLPPAGPPPYSASSYESGHGPELAFDGKQSTFWLSKSPAAGQWIGYDFGKARSISARAPASISPAARCSRRSDQYSDQYPTNINPRRTKARRGCFGS